MKKSLAFMSLAMMATMSETNFGRFNEPEKYKPRIEPKKIDPTNLKEYWFDCFGNFFNEAPFQYSFKCFALNDKNAIRKFNSFMRSNEADA